MKQSHEESRQDYYLIYYILADNTRGLANQQDQHKGMR